MDAGDMAILHPGGQQRDFVIDQGFEIRGQNLSNPRRPLQDLIGKKPAFPGVCTAKFKFARNIGQYFVQRCPVWIHLPQRIQPRVQHPFQQARVDRFLGREVIKQVRFG